MQGLESHCGASRHRTAPKDTEQTPKSTEKQRTRKKPRKTGLQTEHNKHYRTLVVGFE